MEEKQETNDLKVKSFEIQINSNGGRNTKRIILQDVTIGDIKRIREELLF